MPRGPSFRRSYTAAVTSKNRMALSVLLVVLMAVAADAHHARPRYMYCRHRAPAKASALPPLPSFFKSISSGFTPRLPPSAPDFDDPVVDPSHGLSGGTQNHPPAINNGFHTTFSAPDFEPCAAWLVKPTKAESTARCAYRGAASHEA